MLELLIEGDIIDDKKTDDEIAQAWLKELTIRADELMGSAKPDDRKKRAALGARLRKHADRMLAMMG